VRNSAEAPKRPSRRKGSSSHLHPNCRKIRDINNTRTTTQTTAKYASRTVASNSKKPGRVGGDCVYRNAQTGLGQKPVRQGAKQTTQRGKRKKKERYRTGHARLPLVGGGREVSQIDRKQRGSVNKGRWTAETLLEKGGVGRSEWGVSLLDGRRFAVRRPRYSLGRKNGGGQE